MQRKRPERCQRCGKRLHQEHVCAAKVCSWIRCFSATKFLLMCLLLLLFVLPVHAKRTKAETTTPAFEPGFEYITYASVVKLEHPLTGLRLHSQEVAYGTGSKQQTVTAVERHLDDDRALWLIKAPQQSGGRFFAESKGIRRVRCGALIRLEHVVTRTHLHSHRLASPLTGSQEVSAFALSAEGSGDSGDHWQVECISKGAVFWARNETVYLRHVDTETMYLSVLGEQRYHDPLENHAEVVCLERKSIRQPELRAQWVASEGFFHASAAVES
jgi:dolichyl-phosphate-mannose--protein O-mannosyl transferase